MSTTVYDDLPLASTPTRTNNLSAGNETRLIETMNPLVHINRQVPEQSSIYDQDINIEDHEHERNQFNNNNMNHDFTQTVISPYHTNNDLSIQHSDDNNRNSHKTEVATFVSLLCQSDPLVMSADGRIIRRSS